MTGSWKDVIIHYPTGRLFRHGDPHNQLDRGSSVLSAMSPSYATRAPKRARRLLENLARRLEPEYPSAAGSQREGFEETLTIMRLNLPESLELVLSSTNLSENLFSRVRKVARRVKRWQGAFFNLEPVDLAVRLRSAAAEVNEMIEASRQLIRQSKQFLAAWDPQAALPC